MIRASLRLGAIALWSVLFAPFPLLAALIALGRKEALARVGSWHLRVFAKGICVILGIHKVCEGELPPRVAFVAPNHWGYVDVFTLGSIYRSSFVSRADVADWPVMGVFARAAGTLFLDRAKKRDTARIGDVIERHLRRQCRVTAFLEGGSGRGDVVRPYKSALLESAAATGAPCVGAAIRYTLPRDPTLDPSEVVAWADDSAFTTHLWRLLHVRRIDVLVRFGPPRTGTDRKQLARVLEEDVRAALAAPVNAA